MLLHQTVQQYKSKKNKKNNIRAKKRSKQPARITKYNKLKQTEAKLWQLPLQKTQWLKKSLGIIYKITKQKALCFCLII